MRSIQRHVMAWALGATLLGAAVLGGSAYRAVLDEMNETLDASLREVALTIADLPELPASAAARPRPPQGNEQLEIIVQAWSPAGERLFVSRPALALPFVDRPGLSRTQLDGVDWDVYTVLRNGRIVQAAQRAQAQENEAAESTGHILLSLAGVALVAGALLALALRRGLRSLHDAALLVAARSPERLDEIADADAPRELKPLVQAINALMARLAGALAAQRQFVADAAHALRTPVTALRLQLDLLAGARDEGARRVATDELRGGIDRAQHLIERLLQLSRAEGDGQAERLRSVPLAEIARAGVARFAARAEQRGIDLGARIEDGAVSVQADPAQMAVLLDNLVDNALRHTPAGGTIDVAVESTIGGPTLSVIDTGPGIEPAERRRVFDRFYRGAQAGDDTGSGLGLAIARTIADAHGAELSLGDGPRGGGLAVMLRFPPAAPAARAAAPA